MNGCTNFRTIGIDPPLLATKMLCTLFNMIPLLSISFRLNKNGVFVFKIWSSHSPIGVPIMILPIDIVDPIPKVALTAPFSLSLIGILEKNRKYAEY